MDLAKLSLLPLCFLFADAFECTERLAFIMEPVYLEKRMKDHPLTCKFLALKQFGLRQGKVMDAWPMNNPLAFFFIPCIHVDVAKQIKP